MSTLHLATVILAALALSLSIRAEPLIIDASAAQTAATDAKFHLGTSISPEGHEVSVNSVGLLRDGKPWLAVMGEFQYSRYAAREWRDELLKMKAGGVDIVATYVFWIHHEEVEGQWDWSGQRDLRTFLQVCKDV